MAAGSKRYNHELKRSVKCDMPTGKKNLIKKLG